MDTREALQKIESSPPAVPSVGAMLQAIIDKGVTGENVAAMKELVGLYERMEDRNAERAFAQAFTALQSEMKAVQATREVPNNDGTVRYKFAPFEQIMEQVRPHLEKHGFSVSFSTDYTEGRLVKTCTLQHVGGHSKTNKFAVRIGSGPPKASECQADGAASTYAKRFALCDSLNIQVEHDMDAQAEGAPVSHDQAIELFQRATDTESNLKAFLKFCGVESANPTFEDFKRIPAGRYDAASEMLSRKESKGR